jgi:hypothetical protein
MCGVLDTAIHGDDCGAVRASAGDGLPARHLGAPTISRSDWITLRPAFLLETIQSRQIARNT